jgi:DNA repair exonuclease SbcCD ATPase subunit
MSNWTLRINNIGGFKGTQEFLMEEGLNLVVGDNATGKTTLINSLKLLNNINVNEVIKDDQKGNILIYEDFLHNKTKSGSVKLTNEHITYEINITSPVIKITSFLDGSSPSTKSKKRILISNDPNVIKFAYIDKNNKLMESIEYSGTIDLIKEEIIKISNIKNYQILLKHVKKLNFEYLERKEKELKKLNDERKEIELKIRDNLKKSELLENELSKIQVNEELSEELSVLKEDLEYKNNQYNTIRLKTLDSLIEENNKLIATIERDKITIGKLKRNKSECEDFIKLENTITENEKKVQKFDSKLQNLADQKNELNINKRIIDHQFNLLKETLNEKKDAELCQHCLNPINIKRINKKLAELTSNKYEFNENLRNINAEIQTVSKQRNKLNDLISDQKNIPPQIAELSSKINNLQKKIENNKTKKEKLEKEIDTQNQKLTVIQNKIREIQRKIIKVSNQDDNIKEKYSEVITKLNIIKEENDELTLKKNLLVQKVLTLPENYNKLIERTDIFIRKLNVPIERFYLEFIDFINSELEILLKKLNC